MSKQDKIIIDDRRAEGHRAGGQQGRRTQENPTVAGGALGVNASLFRPADNV